MSFSDAFTRLKTLRMSGVDNTAHYYFDDLPTVLPASKLPALVWTLGTADLQSELVDFSEARFVIYLNALFLKGTYIVKAGNEFSGFVDHFDNFITMLSGDWFLNDLLLEPMRVVMITPGEVDWSGMRYLGFRASVRLNVRVD